MFELMQKAIMAGLGAAAMTKEKIEELVDELVKRGEVAAEERPRIVQDLLARLEDSQQVLEQRIQESIQATIAKLGIPTRSSWDELNGRMEELARRMDQIEAQK